MVAFVGYYGGDGLINTGIAFQRSGMQFNAVSHGGDARQTVFRIFEGNATYDPVDFVTLRHQQFGQIRSVLTGDPRNQRSTTHRGMLSRRASRDKDSVAYPRLIRYTS